MPVRAQYRSDGIWFQIQCGGKFIGLPLGSQGTRAAILNSDATECIKDEHYSLIRCLNELKLELGDGLLGDAEKGYLLDPEHFYEVVESEKESIRDLLLELPVPKASPALSIDEIGHVGRSDYEVCWNVLIYGRPYGDSERVGCIVRAGKDWFCLSHEQYDLLTTIEQPPPMESIEDRARYQARCKSLAIRAGARMSNFTENRDFLFPEVVECRPVMSEDGREIRFEPIISDADKKELGEAEDLFHQGRHEGISCLYRNGKRTKVVWGDGVGEKAQSIAELTPVTGTDVPKFARNPLQFLPDDVSEQMSDDELEGFADRVKGLKIRTSRAMPYLNVTKAEGPSGKSGGWFNIDAGYKIEDDQNDDVDAVPGEKNNDISQQIVEAAKRGEHAVYDEENGKWIEFDPEKILSFEEARQKANLSDEPVTSQSKNLILDIFENIEGIEYTENIPEASNDNIPFDGSHAEVEFQAPPASFRGKLKKYQLEGYNFIRSNYEHNRGVLLADDMGLGKTIQVIAFLLHLQGKDLLSPALVVLPKTLIENWQNEIRKFAPTIRGVYVHQGWERRRRAEEIGRFEIVLTTYETLARDQVELGKVRWSCVISDESQRVKNFRTLAANAIKGMNTKFRIAMTGTPVENRLAEFWSIVDFVQPGLLGSYKEFRHAYELPIQQDEHGKIDQLVNAVAPIYLRRTKEKELAAELPPKEEQHVFLQLNKIQKDLIAKSIRDHRRSQQKTVLPLILRILEISSHPRLVDNNGLQGSGSMAELMEESPKLEWLMDELEEIKQRGDKAVLFTRFVRMQSILQRTISERFDVLPEIINGTIHSSRQRIIDEFGRVPGFNVLILSPDAAGVGLNVTSANHVIHFTRVWNPAVENQSTDRCYRIGQEKPVHVYYPVMLGKGFMSPTPEERLNDILTSKRELMKNVIIPKGLEQDIKASDFKDIVDNYQEKQGLFSFLKR